MAFKQMPPHFTDCIAWDFEAGTLGYAFNTREGQQAASNALNTSRPCGPSFFGSTLCQSHGIAAPKGWRPYCTCDLCY